MSYTDRPIERRRLLKHCGNAYLRGNVYLNRVLIAEIAFPMGKNQPSSGFAVSRQLYRA